MSDTDPEQEPRDELATSRLLELLRAQQAGAGQPVEETPVTETPPAEEPPEVESSVAPEELTVPPVDTAQEAEGVVEEAPPTAEVPSKSLLDSLARLAETETPEPAPAVEAEPSTPTPPAETSPEPEAAEPEVSIPEQIPGDLLQQIQLQTAPAEEEEEVEPEEFDATLFSVLSVREQRPVYHHYLGYSFRYLNESRRRLAIVLGDNCLRLLQTRAGLRGVSIEKAKSFHLPFQAEDHIINDSRELLAYVLESEVDVKERRNIFGAVYFPEVTSRTRIFQTPQIKKSELADLVDWNVKKSIPFKPDQAAVNWEATDALGDSTKQNVVVGIAEKGPLLDMIDLFREYKIKLRLYSTLPILLWKLFLRNYPDRKEGCYALVHIGFTLTTVAVVVDEKLVFTREITLGAQDFYEAVMQKVAVGDRSVEIDENLAREILRDYGIPHEAQGVIPKSKISLYKISIFLRPVVERLTNELSRSLNYFKKQHPDIDWELLLFTGLGATFPNLVTVMKRNLDIDAELLHPMRNGNYEFAPDVILSDRQLPTFALNFALTAEETERVNVLPQNVRASYRYIFMSKFAASLVAFFIPFFGTTIFYSNHKIDSLAAEVEEKKQQWNRLSDQSKEYFDLLTDMEILEGFSKFMHNDRVYSVNQIKILKLLSSITSDEIKFTALAFKKQLIDEKKNQPDNPRAYMDVLDISGFVQSDPSIADIQLTNFAIQLEQSGVFTRVEKEMQETSESDEEWRLFFTFHLLW
jgi:Tfp pilus assembly PilM family ATPase